MPNCFTLTLKGEKEPSTLKVIDEMICAEFDIEIHPKYYAVDWYNTIGFGIATANDRGLGTQKLRDYLKDFTEGEKLLEVEAFLNERFTDRAWYQVSKVVN